MDYDTIESAAMAICRTGWGCRLDWERLPEDVPHGGIYFPMCKQDFRNLAKAALATTASSSTPL